jgi:NTP pyrophosphatase (non-canonical NTP hydrolase)
MKMSERTAMKELQNRVAQFVNEHQLEAPPESRLLDLVSELGELAKEVLKGSEYGAAPFRQTPDWQSELGDVFFSLVCLANSTEVDLEAALETVLEKYKTRLDGKGDASSGR